MLTLDAAKNALDVMNKELAVVNKKRDEVLVEVARTVLVDIAEKNGITKFTYDVSYESDDEGGSYESITFYAYGGGNVSDGDYCEPANDAVYDYGFTKEILEVLSIDKWGGEISVASLKGD